MTLNIEWRLVYEGANLELAVVGSVVIGRVKFGFEPGWMCHLPGASGSTYQSWRKCKDRLSARNELLAHFRDWTRAIGLVEASA